MRIISRMKNRDYKAFAPGEYYHIFNRGNGKMNIFEDTADYYFFLSRLEEYLFPTRRRASSATLARYERKSFPEGAFSLVCYALMPNHFHFLLRQNDETSLSEFMRSVSTGYSKYFNKKYTRVGSLFQDQFKAVPVRSNDQLLWLSAYIHQNPKVARLVESLDDYEYSSYKEYMAHLSNPLCEKGIMLEQFSNIKAYREFVEESFDAIKQRKDLEPLLLD